MDNRRSVKHLKEWMKEGIYFVVNLHSYAHSRTVVLCRIVEDLAERCDHQKEEIRKAINRGNGLEALLVETKKKMRKEIRFWYWMTLLMCVLVVMLSYCVKGAA